ncbi:hypothetical protein D3C76_1636570 [compost metagenome]
MGLLQFLATVPTEVDALPCNLLTFLAHLFALARTQSVEKVLKVAVAMVAPVELTSQALHPARQAGHLCIQAWVGEVDVSPG